MGNGSGEARGGYDRPCAGCGASDAWPTELALGGLGSRLVWICQRCDHAPVARLLTGGLGEELAGPPPGGGG